MRTIDIIVKKRNGEELNKQEIDFLIDGFVREEIPDYQMAAFLMSVYFLGMSFAETALLTRLMMDSGEKFDLSGIKAMKVDKHSTGGVGDKVSLILAPLVASAGIPVPMVSGRGLGHTGGTLDKLESIPGFCTNLKEEDFIRQVKKIGTAIIGQTDNFVPADKKLYALRDVTGTVDSIPLISASIVSKKVASGTDGFVFDVKTGTGAFMPTQEKAKELARCLIGVVRELGKKAIALITDMNQPLGEAVGNSLEVIECISVLKEEITVPDLKEICLELGARMLVLGEKESSIEKAKNTLEQKLHSGEALEKFRQMVEAQGGDSGIIDKPLLCDVSPKNSLFKAPQKGYIAAYNTREIGNASMILGAGRLTYDDPIDYGVGLLVHKKIGDFVEKGKPLFTLYYREDKSLEQAEKRLASAIKISGEKINPQKLIKEEIR